MACDEFAVKALGRGSFNETENDRKIAALLADCHAGSVIKARNNLLAVWLCGETQLGLHLQRETPGW
jgi:hypothetical protein